MFMANQPVSRPTWIDKTIGKNAKSLRATSGMTQDEAAEKMGISKALLSLLERGERPWNSNTLVAAIETYKSSAVCLVSEFGITPEELEMLMRFRAAHDKDREIVERLLRD